MCSLTSLFSHKQQQQQQQQNKIEKEEVRDRALYVLVSFVLIVSLGELCPNITLTLSFSATMYFLFFVVVDILYRSILLDITVKTVLQILYDRIFTGLHK